VIGQAKLVVGDLQLPVGIVNNAGKYGIQFMPVDINRVEFLVVGLVLIIVLMIRPDGILPEKSTFTMSKSRLARLVTKNDDRKDSAVG